VESQNLNFGPTNTIPNATTHNPAIHAYSTILPHHHRPSLILRSIPILLVAAPILSAFLSKAAAVVDRVFSSAARTALRAREEFFRADARSKREDVRSSWVAVADSRVLAVRVDGVEVVMEVGDVVV